jgi:hypothetical protein
MQILTHPANKKWIDEIIPKAEKAMNDQSYHILKLNSVQVIFEENMKPTRPSTTRFKDVTNNRFCEFPKTNPSDWEIYFGFVEPEEELNFVAVLDNWGSCNHSKWMQDCYIHNPSPFVVDNEKKNSISTSRLTIHDMKQSITSLQKNIRSIKSCGN